MESISAKELKKLIDDKSKDFVLVDVRSLEEWNQYHINDSRVINLDVNKLVKDYNSLPQDKKIYVICESGGRSSFSQVFLKAKGINAVDVFDGMSAYRKL